VAWPNYLFHHQQGIQGSRNKEIIEPIIVIVGEASTPSKLMVVYLGLRSHIGERAVSVVSVQLRWTLKPTIATAWFAG
jgi:hypothetical protein